MPLIPPYPGDPPLSTDPDNFDTRADAGWTWWTQMVPAVQALEAGLAAANAPGGLMIPYAFDASTTMADPGAGKARFNNATQASATVIAADLASAIGTDATGLLDSLGLGTSAVKHQLRIQKAGDPTKFLLFDVTDVTTPGGGGHRQLAVSNGYPAGTSPFVAADNLIFTASRVGDRGVFPAYDLLATALVSSPVSAITFAAITDAYSDLIFTLDGLTAASSIFVGVSVFDGSSWSAAAMTYPASASHSGEVWLPGYQRGFGACHSARAIVTPGASPDVTIAANLLANSPIDFLWRASPRISGVRFSTSSGDFTAGTIKMYGH